MNKEIDKLAWIFIIDNKLLVARSKDKSLFYLPGGKRDLGENDEQALIREIKEELSVDLLTQSIKYAQTFTAPADGKNGDITVKLSCYFAEFDGQLAPDAEIAEFDFVGFQQQKSCSLATVKVLAWLNQQGLIN